MMTDVSRRNFILGAAAEIAVRPVGKRPAYWDAMRDDQNGRRFAFIMPGAADT